MAMGRVHHDGCVVWSFISLEALVLEKWSLMQGLIIVDADKDDDNTNMRKWSLCHSYLLK